MNSLSVSYLETTTNYSNENMGICCVLLIDTKELNFCVVVLLFYVIFLFCFACHRTGFENFCKQQLPTGVSNLF